MDARVTKMTQRYAFRLLFQSDQKYAITMQLDGFTAKHSEDASGNRQLLYYRIKKLKDYYLNIFLLRYPYRIYEIAFFYGNYKPPIPRRFTSAFQRSIFWTLQRYRRISWQWNWNRRISDMALEIREKKRGYFRLWQTIVEKIFNKNVQFVR